MDNIVIFGASGGAVKVAKTLKNLKIDFRYFVDNDKNKWGKVVEGKVVPCILCQHTILIPNHGLRRDENHLG